MKQQQQTLLFTHPVRVYYHDTDAGGVVYHANYLIFMEQARTEWLRSCGLEQDELKQQENIVFIIRSIHIDYKKPAFFNQQLNITLAILDQSKSYFTCYQQVLSSDNVLIAEATIKLVCVDAQRLRPKRLPESILRVINRAD